jgi:hypothetical protein
MEFAICDRSIYSGKRTNNHFTKPTPNSISIKEQKMAEHRCETCPMRLKAEKNPKSLMSRLWKWHTGWCPGWKAYQKSLQAKAN